MAKMNANLYVIEDYENETTHRPKKTNPNKPNPERSRMAQFHLPPKACPELRRREYKKNPMPVLRGQISVFCLGVYPRCSLLCFSAGGFLSLATERSAIFLK